MSDVREQRPERPARLSALVRSLDPGFHARRAGSMARSGDQRAGPFQRELDGLAGAAGRRDPAAAVDFIPGGRSLPLEPLTNLELRSCHDRWGAEATRLRPNRVAARAHGADDEPDRPAGLTRFVLDL